MKVECPYCGKDAKLVSGKTIYPHRPDLFPKRFYVCEPCDARVGCHGNTEQPLGRLADATLRRAKRLAHLAFDPIWSGRKRKMRRSAAYQWLAKQLGIPVEDCHIGMFDVALCDRTVVACRRFWEADGC